MNYWDVEPLNYWDNLIFTLDAPKEPKGWGLRGHDKKLKSKTWFEMIILSEGCNSRYEAQCKAIEFTKRVIEKEMILKFEKA